MKDLIIVENYVDPQCIRHLHLMSNFFIALPPGSLERGVLKQETGVWHYRAEYPYRGVLDIACVGSEKKFRRLVVWSLTPPLPPPHLGTNGEGKYTIRNALSQAHTFFWSTFRFQPGYAFMRRLPAAAREANDQDVEGMVLLEATWMLEKCVAVGGKG